MTPWILDISELDSRLVLPSLKSSKYCIFLLSSTTNYDNTNKNKYTSVTHIQFVHFLSIFVRSRNGVLSFSKGPTEYISKSKLKLRNPKVNCKGVEHYLFGMLCTSSVAMVHPIIKTIMTYISPTSFNIIHSPRVLRCKTQCCSE